MDTNSASVTVLWEVFFRIFCVKVELGPWSRSRPVASSTLTWKCANFFMSCFPAVCCSPSGRCLRRVRALYTGTGPGPRCPRHEGGVGVTGTPGVVLTGQTFVIMQRVRTTTTSHVAPCVSFLFLITCADMASGGYHVAHCLVIGAITVAQLSLAPSVLACTSVRSGLRAFPSLFLWTVCCGDGFFDVLQGPVPMKCSDNFSWCQVRSRQC